MKHAILYTDGSFKPNVEGDLTLGCYGAGVHGYVYDDEIPPKAIGDAPSNYYLTTVGYVINSEYDKETHKLVIPTHYIDATFSFINKGTISVAEVLGIISALQAIYDNLEQLQVSDVLLYSDSTYALMVFEIVTNNLDTFGKIAPSTPNYDLYCDLKSIISQFKLKGISIKTDKIQAHSIHIGNNIADDLAYLARKRSGERIARKQIDIFTTNANTKKSNKYWVSGEDEHELLKFKQLFFTNSLRAQRDEILYSIMNYKTDVEPGTKTHDALLGLVSMANPPTIIEDAIKSYHKLCAISSVLSTVNLKNLYLKDVSYYYKLYGSDIFTFIFKRRSLFKRDIPIVTPVTPPGLTTKLLMDMQFLYGFISTYRNIKEQLKDDSVRVNGNVIYKDITDKLYGVVKNKNVCIIPQGITYIDIEDTFKDQHVKFPISLGKDTLDRNQFKRLESKDPKVILIVDTKSDKCLEYHTLIDVGDAIGVYTNLYSNKVVLG